MSRTFRNTKNVWRLDWIRKSNCFKDYITGQYDKMFCFSNHKQPTTNIQYYENLIIRFFTDNTPFNRGLPKGTMKKMRISCRRRLKHKLVNLLKSEDYDNFVNIKFESCENIWNYD